MSELKDTSLSDLAIDRGAIRAMLRLPALFVDFLAYLCSLHVVNTGTAELFQEIASLYIGQKNPGAILQTISH